MEKAFKIPTVEALKYFSYIVALAGLAISASVIIFDHTGARSFILGFLILLASLLIACLVRMLANIGQVLFDFKDLEYQKLDAMSQNARQAEKQNLRLIAENQALYLKLEALLSSIKDGLSSIKDGSNNSARFILEDLQMLKNNLEQINCDSKDMAQNIHQIKSFFEQIERHLELKP